MTYIFLFYFVKYVFIMALDGPISRGFSTCEVRRPMGKSRAVQTYNPVNASWKRFSHPLEGAMWLVSHQATDTPNLACVIQYEQK